MELDEMTVLKIIHYTVKEFIACIKNCIPSEVLSIQKAFQEIIKRRVSVSQGLQSIAMHVKTSIETSALCIPDMKQLLSEEIQKLVDNIFLQDFFELALNARISLSISDDELYNFLFDDTVMDVTSFSFSSSTLDMALSGYMDFDTPLCSPANNSIQSPSLEKFNGGLLSSEFENARMKLEYESSILRRITEYGFSVSDLSKFNVATILENESNDATSNVIQESEVRCFQDPVTQSDFLQPSISRSDSDAGILSDFSEDSDSFLSWEGCMGKFLHDHSYISELTPEAALLNISEKESQMYYSLLNPSNSISEDDMVHDVLDLLIGIPSNTFFYDIHARKFMMNPGVHLLNLSPECTANMVAKFIELGSMYYALQNFSLDSEHASKGFVFRGMLSGVQHILHVYKEYIVAVKVNSPSMLFLKSDVLKNAEIFQSCGVICGIDPQKMAINEIPKGLALLSYLHDIQRSDKRKENGIICAVILCFAYAPYFSFINEWMTEGVCYDPFSEFQIVEDLSYLGRRDALYWKFAYTENIVDPIRVVPLEIKPFSQGILDCGKSIGLLRICCPEFSSLKIFSSKPPPSLSMVFSFPAAVCRLKECMKYIVLKENEYLIPDSGISYLFDDSFYIESQKLVNEQLMMKLVKRRWGIMCASKVTNSNVIDFKTVSQHLKTNSTDCIDAIKSFKSLNKCERMPLSVTENKYILKGKIFRNVGPLFSSCVLKCMHEDIFKLSTFKPICFDILRTENEDHFSGLLKKDVGLVFSCCGYIESDMKLNSLSEDNDCSFSLLNFNKQLQLISYNENSLPSKRNNINLFSSEIEFLDAFYNSNIKDESFVEKNENLRTKVKEDKIDDDRDSSSLTCSNNLKETEDLNFATIRVEKENGLNSFMDKLASLLISEYGDSIDDINSCIQVTSIQRLMLHNFNAVLKMRIHLIEKMLMKYIVKQLGLDSLLSSLQKIYFFQDGAFSQSLCEPLFSLVMKCRTPRQFANWPVLNEILANAISNSNNENNPFLSSLNVNIAFVPDEMPIERTDFLRLFYIEFEVKWPLNIIIHQTCIQQYLDIFSTLLEIEFLCWLLGRIWKNLIITCKRLQLDDTPQYRDLMLKRFDMDQFVRVIRKSIHQHLQGPLWQFLEKGLSGEGSSIDDLENIHMQYLEKAMARCFLTDETHVLHELLSTMFHQVYKFCSTISECEWKINEQTGHYETYTFKGLVAAFNTYKQYQLVFLKRVLKESLTKKCGRYWDKGYQDFLETISETERTIS